MSDPLYGPDRSITFYLTSKRTPQAVPSEWTLAAGATLALALVVLTLVLGGCG